MYAKPPSRSMLCLYVELTNIAWRRDWRRPLRSCLAANRMEHLWLRRRAHKYSLQGLALSARGEKHIGSHRTDQDRSNERSEPGTAPRLCRDCGESMPIK